MFVAEGWAVVWMQEQIIACAVAVKLSLCCHTLLERVESESEQEGFGIRQPLILRSPGYAGEPPIILLTTSNQRDRSTLVITRGVKFRRFPATDGATKTHGEFQLLRGHIQEACQNIHLGRPLNQATA